MDRLEELRRALEVVDKQTVALVARRLELAREVGEYKKFNNLPIFNGEVEEHKMQRAATLAKKHNLDANFVRSLLYLIINESCKEQAKIQNG